MGFSMACNIFTECTAEDVISSLKLFYSKNKAQSRKVYDQVYGSDQPSEQVTVYDYGPSWVLVEFISEPIDWIEFRQSEISRELTCPGFMVFSDDGNYWGYQFFSSGKIVDTFSSDAYFHSEHSEILAPGDVDAVCRQLGSIDPADFATYLIQRPNNEIVGDDELIKFERSTNGKPRKGDRFDRWDEAACINFLEFLGISYKEEKYGYLRPKKNPRFTIDNWGNETW